MQDTNNKSYISNIFKGMAMGAANVIPGVSGGTIALITGIFERLINAIKSFNLTAINLLFKGQIKDFIKHIDLWFLISVFTGVGIAIISLAKLFKYLFEAYPVYIWAYFFGLVLASVYFVGKTVEKWNIGTIITFIIGTAVAVAMVKLSPASENSSMLYLFICGIVAICSMIIPGLSGSFVLILMGNYNLIMIDSVSSLDFKVLIPVAIGAAVGLIGFSHFLSWLLKKYKDLTISMLTGFILGSLAILWPWQKTITQTFGEKEKIVARDWLLPQMNTELAFAVVLIILGIATIWITETLGAKSQQKEA